MVLRRFQLPTLGQADTAGNDHKVLAARRIFWEGHRVIAEPFANHLTTDKSQKQSGNPVIDVADEVVDAAASQPAQDAAGGVDDVELLPKDLGKAVELRLDPAGILDAAVRGRVDLDDVQRGAAAPDAKAARALAARFAVVALPLAVEGHGEHARERRLAGPSRPAQQVAVGHATAGNRALQRSRHVGLHGDPRERLRAVLSGEGEEHGIKLQTVDGGR